MEFTDKTQDVPKKSLVRVQFPNKEIQHFYYNDRFDLKVGDFVHVEGEMEGTPGRVTEVNHHFKIKLSDYRKVTALVDTDVHGKFYIAGSHFVSFEPETLPPRQILTWFKAAEEEFVSSTDGSSFPLEDLSAMKIAPVIAQRGYDYYLENRVRYLNLNQGKGFALVEGNEHYTVEFTYRGGQILDLLCDCPCAFTCKHEFAAMLQLKKTLEFITKNYETEHKDYFAAISKNTFMNIVMGKKSQARLVFEDNYRF